MVEYDLQTVSGATGKYHVSVIARGWWFVGDAHLKVGANGDVERPIAEHGGPNIYVPASR